MAMVLGQRRVVVDSRRTTLTGTEKLLTHAFEAKKIRQFRDTVSLINYRRFALYLSTDVEWLILV